MFPQFHFAPTIEFPASGDVTQDITTSWFSRMEGIPQIEMDVITGAASYGTQLDKLIEAVLEIAGDASGDGEKVAELREMAGRIEAAKDASVEKLEARIRVLEEKVAKMRGRREEGEGFDVAPKG